MGKTNQKQMSNFDDKRDDTRSLIKYAQPVIVSTTGKRGKDGKKDAKGEKDITSANTEDILNSILPPREYTKDKQQLYIESVLSTPATKADVVMLQQDLDKRLQSRQARETGICPIREELYAQCFDELIRQITINCSHRGLLLVRVRDEMRMTIQAYQTLYESALAYGMRKALQVELKKMRLTTDIKSLESNCIELEKTVYNLDEEINRIQEQDKHQQEKDMKAHMDEVGQIKKKNQRLKDELEKKLSGK